MKTCTKCHVEKALTEFSPDKRPGSGRQAQCKTCCAAYYRAYRAARPDHIRAARIKWSYGLAQADRAEMFERQCGLCAIPGCGSPAIVVDHCHDCEDIDRRGSVRGLLCHWCNRSLDRIARFSPMHAAYLAIHAAVCPAFDEQMVC